MANFSYRFSMYNINGERPHAAHSQCPDQYDESTDPKQDQTNEIMNLCSSSMPYLLLPAEALNQGDTVDLDALMADLCSIEQELNTISKPNSTSRSHNKGQQRAPGGRSASTKHTGTSGGGSSGGSQ